MSVAVVIVHGLEHGAQQNFPIEIGRIVVFEATPTIFGVTCRPETTEWSLALEDCR